MSLQKPKSCHETELDLQPPEQSISVCYYWSWEFMAKCTRYNIM
jgi:hypothetical protein